MWTKRQIVEEAFGELALASYVFDLTPDELNWALRRMDTMVASWLDQGISVGYVFGPSQQASDLDQDSGVPLKSTRVVYLQLAQDLAAGKGKTLPPSSILAAKKAWDALLIATAHDELTEMQTDVMPVGAGHKTRRPFTSTPDTSELGDGLEFLGN